MTDQERKEKIIAECQQVLSSCDGFATPKLCQRLSDETGMAWAINRMIHLMLNENISTPKACLPHLEQELEGL